MVGRIAGERARTIRASGAAGRRRRLRADVEGLEGRTLLSADVLVVPNFYSTIREYTPTGTFVRSLSVPYPDSNPNTEYARDVVVDPAGNIQVYNGTFHPYLSTYSPLTGTWTQHLIPGGFNINNISYGGIGATGQYVFVTEMNTAQSGTPTGIVRFDTSNGYSTTRFGNADGYIDLTIGLDGKLYALSESGSVVNVFDPQTLQQLGSIRLSGDNRGLAVNAAGELYVANWSGYLDHYSASGTFIDHVNPGIGSLSDVDLAPDGSMAEGAYSSSVSVNGTAFAGGGSICAFVAFGSLLAPNVTAAANQSGKEGQGQFYSLGSFTEAGNGPWNVDVNWGDGSADSTFDVQSAGSLGSLLHSFPDNGQYLVAVKVRDAAGASGSTGFTADIANVAPTAAVGFTSRINEGSSGAVIGFSNVIEYSPADVAAGFKYSFDFTNDGTFDIVDSSSPSALIPRSLYDDGPAVITSRARVADKDGGFTDYVVKMTVTNVAPHAQFTGTSQVFQGSNATVSFSFPSDPSIADTAAGFIYSYDFNDDGTFEISNSTATTATVPGSYLQTVGFIPVHGRITDKDGGFTDYTATIRVNPAPTVTLGGTVFGDNNGDGVFDPGETGVPGVRVFLDANQNQKFDLGELAVTTDASGAYQFANIAPGTYSPCIGLPTGWKETDDLPQMPMTYGPNALVNGLDLGVQSAPLPSIQPPASVGEGGTITLDGSASTEYGGTLSTYEWDTNYQGGFFVARATGVTTPFSAVGLNGPSTWTVALRVTDARGVSAIATATVNVTNAPPTATFSAAGPVTLGATGSVSFANPFDPAPADVKAGFKYSYDFNNDGVFEVINSTLPTATVPATYLATVGKHTIRGRIADWDGGYSDYTADIQVNAPTLASIAGAVFADNNGNGKKDVGEAAVLGRKLYIDKNKNGALDSGEPIFTTAADGSYKFSGLAAGTYRIRDVLPTGWRRVSPSAGYFDVTVSAGQQVTAKDFAETRNVAISGVVFKDTNANGKQDSGEAALNGWTVFLDTNNNGKLDPGEASITTDATGRFTFVVPAGTFHLREVLKSGFTRTTPTAGVYTLTLSAGQTTTGKIFGDK